MYLTYSLHHYCRSTCKCFESGLLPQKAPVMIAKRQSWTFLPFSFFPCLYKTWVHMYVLGAQHSTCMCGLSVCARASVGMSLCLSIKHRAVYTACRAVREHCNARLALQGNSCFAVLHHAPLISGLDSLTSYTYALSCSRASALSAVLTTCCCKYQVQQVLNPLLATQRSP